MTGLSETNMVDVLLKHIHRLVPFYACFPKINKYMLKVSTEVGNKPTFEKAKVGYWS